MEKFLNEDLQKQLKEMFSVINEEVNIVLFKDEKENSKMTEQLLDEIVPLNEKLNLTKYDFDTNKEEAKKYNVINSPAYLVFNKEEEPRGVFYGIPLGHEINTLLATIIDAGGSYELYEKEVLDQIELINKPTNIKVFVTTACPHCPGAAINALRLALLNKNVNAEIFEVHSNEQMSDKYKVSGVPKIVINEKKELMGDQPVEAFLQTILK